VPVSQWITVSDFSHEPATSPILIHWVGGSIVLFCGPLQLIASIRRKFPKFHGWNGKIYLFGCILTSFGGFFYLVLNGTVGGISMDISFAIYGVALLFCAIMAFREGFWTKNIKRHREWALRTFYLGFASAFYRFLAFPLVLSSISTSIQVALGRDQKIEWLNVIAWIMYLPYVIVEIYIQWSKRKTRKLNDLDNDKGTEELFSVSNEPTVKENTDESD